jgi:hypothetical protein
VKLNPPASSSDLETAREIARRLHQSRRREDRDATTWSSEEAPARPRLTPPPLPRPHSEPVAGFQPPARPAPAPAPALSPSPEPAPPPDLDVEVDSSEPSFDLPETPAFERPSWSEPPAARPEPTAIEDLAASFEPTPFASGEPQLQPQLPDVDVDVDEPPLSPEAMIGEANEIDASPFDQLTAPEAPPFDEELLAAPPVAEEPGPPSWDEIVETCMGLAQATGAMLVDPAGQVFAARGDWPAPGPDAIATKLVTMMAKTLKDAPTRSISAPLMGMHLTAWRVPLSEGLVTAAFIGAAPVRAEARPAVDAEIRRGAGA